MNQVEICFQVRQFCCRYSIEVNFNPIPLTNFTHLGLILALSYFVLGCQKAVPNLGSLAEIQGFSIDQSYVVANQKSNPGFSVSGGCPAAVTQIEISFDKGKTWINSANLATLTVECSTNGHFSLNFNKDLSLYILDENSLKINGLSLRGQTAFGATNAGHVAVQKNGTEGFPTSLVASSQFTKTGNYFVRSTMTVSANGTTPVVRTNNSNYIVKNFRVGATK